MSKKCHGTNRATNSQVEVGSSGNKIGAGHKHQEEASPEERIVLLVGEARLPNQLLNVFSRRVAGLRQVEANAVLELLFVGNVNRVLHRFGGLAGILCGASAIDRRSETQQGEDRIRALKALTANRADDVCSAVGKKLGTREKRWSTKEQIDR